jgi:hypothetical protein
MQDRTTYRSQRRGSRLAAPLLFLAFALPLLYGGYQARQNERAARRLLPVARRAVTLCSAFTDACHTTGEPTLLDEKLPRPQGTWKHRRLWSVECAANGRAYALLLNASTGELCSLYAEGRTSRETFSEPSVSPLKQPEQAVEASLRLMRSLNMVPAGGKIALVGTPRRIQTKKAWEVLWNVRRPDTAQPTQIKMQLDQYSGVPTLIVDTHALNNFTKA